ncbi:MAG: hypothetical protein GY832_31045 [Chloroflexi bacterium]|nr:hypothetical protein [Chloroflexota bacterium]
MLRWYYEHPAEFSQLCRAAAKPADYYHLQDFHREWINLVHENPKTMLVAPRGFLKSSVTTVDYTVYHTLFSGAVQRKAFLVCDSQRKYREFILEIAAIMQSPLIQNLFGGFPVRVVENTVAIAKHPRIPWEPKTHVDRARPAIMGMTVDQSATGMHLGNDDLIVFDDAFVSFNNQSQTKQEARKLKIYSGWMPMIAPDTKIVVSGTRYTVYDEYETLPGKGYATNPNTRAAIHPDGTALWADKYPVDVLYNLRDTRYGSIQFALQFMNDVSATEGLLFSPDLLDRMVLTDPAEPRYRCYGIDMAYGGADSTAVCRAELQGVHIVLHPVLLKNFPDGSIAEKTKTIVRLTGNYPTWVEANGPQKQNVDILRQAGHHLIYPYQPGSKTKGLRAQALLAAMERGEIRILDDARQTLRNQLISFTGDDSVHDDMVDAAIICWEAARKMVSNDQRYTSPDLTFGISERRKSYMRA